MKPSTAKKLVQAAALASVLVPLGSVAVETATITCISQGSGCSQSGSYFASGSSTQSNIWKFFESEDSEFPIYTLEIIGDPTSDFTLRVRDDVVNQNDLNVDLAFPNADCIPIFGLNLCSIFEVTVTDGDDSWLDGYEMIMTWFTNEDDESQPPDDGDNHILKSEDGLLFDQVLSNSEYDPSPTPTDPALGGRGDSFSSFIAARADVPEPSTLLLLGTGLATAMYRRRRRQR